MSLFDNEPDIITSRDTTTADIREIIDLMAQGRMDPCQTPHQVLPVSACCSAYDDLVARKVMRVIFDWR